MSRPGYFRAYLQVMQALLFFFFEGGEGGRVRESTFVLIFQVALEFGVSEKKIKTNRLASRNRYLRRGFFSLSLSTQILGLHAIINSFPSN